MSYSLKLLYSYWEPDFSLYFHNDDFYIYAATTDFCLNKPNNQSKKQEKILKALESKKCLKGIVKRQGDKEGKTSEVCGQILRSSLEKKRVCT